MKKNYIIVLAALFFSGITIAQEPQKNFINYQGVARNGADQLMANETMTIGIALKMGSATGASAYAENHSVVTDANGVFSLKIGNGDAISGDYGTIPWGGEATFVTVLINGAEIGTTEMMAVPYALSSGDGPQEADEVPYDNAASGLAATNTQEAIDELVGSGTVDADADPTNEIQDISLVGTDLSISAGSTIDLSPIIPPGGTDNQNAMEVPYDNAISGLTATDTQGALDELATSGLVDTDDQDLSLSGTTLQITDGASVDLSPIIPPGGTDDQNAMEVPYDNAISGLAATDTQGALDELATSGLVDTDDQDLSLLGTTLQITDGASVDLSPIIPAGGTDDQNAVEVPYDNAISGLVAANTQDALDELAAGAMGGSSLWEQNGSTINYSTGNVGIGIATPQNEHHVHNSAASSTLYTLEGYGSDPGDGLSVGITEGLGAAVGFISLRENGPLFFDTNGLTRMAIREGGAVGIGTAVPQAPLDIAGQNNWDLNTTEGDFRLGNDTYRLKMSTSLAGAGAGNARIRSQGGSNKLLLGSGSLDVLSIVDNWVGIGTIDPTIALDVVGSIRSSDLSGTGQRNVVADADGNLIIGSSGGETLSFPFYEEITETGAAFHLQNNTGISGYGLVGSKGPGAATLPSNSAGVLGQATNGHGVLGHSENDFFAGVIGVSNSTTGYGVMGFGIGDGIGGRFFTTATGRAALSTGVGNVGFGTEDPTAKTHVLHDSNLSTPQLRLEEIGDDYARLELKNDQVSSFWHLAGLARGSSADSKLNFYYNDGVTGRDRMTILGNGNIGIGGSNPTAKLHIFQGGQALDSGLRFSDGINQDWTIRHGAGLSFFYGTDRMATISASNGAYIQVSDARMKSNIESLGEVLEKVAQLRPATYNYKADKSKKSTVGLIAQELKPIFPELVSISGDEKLLGLDYGALSVIAIKAIQEQQQLLNAQSRKIEILEERLQRLEARMDN